MFAELLDAQNKNELILVENGISRFHIRRDGQCTIREILSTRLGVGSAMLATIIQRAKYRQCRTILARCPVEYEANAWWEKRGFILDRIETTRTGKQINVWIFQL